MSELPELIRALDTVDQAVELCAIAEDLDIALSLQARIALAHQRIAATVAKLLAPPSPLEPGASAPPQKVAHGQLPPALCKPPLPAAGTLAEEPVMLH